MFWANTEIVLELLTKKGQHAEQFTGYARKPKLMARFRERIEEYRRFWENVELTCTNYLTGIQLPADDVSMQESDSDAYSVDSNETFSINSKGTTSAGNLPQPKNQEVPAMYAFLDKNKKPPARGQF